MKHNLDDFLNIEALADAPPDESLNLIGTVVDAASDAKRSDVLKHCIKLAKTIPCTKFCDEYRALLDYYIANSWSGLKQLRDPHPSGTWEWNQPEIEGELFHLRRARRSKGFVTLPIIHKCQILTNQGNCLDNIGRFVEAIESWDEALLLDPQFGMARGNLGIGLSVYANMLYDKNHSALLAKFAWSELQSPLLHDINPTAAHCFQESRDKIEGVIHADFLKRDIDLDKFELGDTEEESNYRRWCLDQRLFLNPLNELGAYTVAARDVLTCPSVVSEIDEGPIFHAFFNQLKQEFCSARWLAYEGIVLPEQHFSDKDVLLYNTLDYPSYSLATEKLKLAFRSLYSLFDKIAFFLNSYMKLDIPKHKVSFRRVWFKKQKEKKGIREEFEKRENLPLRGLFWLAKDIIEDREDFRSVMDPDARKLNEVRNHLEHKYLKLHLELWSRTDTEDDVAAQLTDTLAHSIYRSEFESMVLRLLRLSRAALIYLALGVHREEQVKAEKRAPGTVTTPITLDSWDDDWKC